MIAAAVIDDTLMDPYEAEWRILRAHRLNVLLEGPALATNAVLRLLQPHLPEPIRWRQPQRALTLPTEETGALILKDVTALGVDDQRRLLDWIECDRCGQFTDFDGALSPSADGRRALPGSPSALRSTKS